MSGIAGIIRFDGGPVETEQIMKITAAMACRGPDGINHWVRGSVALGQCMLRTTPESLEESQPLANEDESLVVVMDGRLDNREELRLELRSKGIILRNRTDAELVLGAYKLWVEDSPRHFLGDFAFAVWDVHRQRLFCVRDHLGIKPFYYVCGKKFLAFASDDEAFYGLAAISLEPNEDRIAAVLVPQFDGAFDYRISCLKDVIALPPGSTLSVQRTGQVAIRTYWQLKPLEENRYVSDLECEEAFRSVFSEAVRCRIKTVGHPALMLSGGIDSASIAGAVRGSLCEMPHRELDTFSAVSDEAATCAETRNIRAITKGYEEYSHYICVPTCQSIISVDDLKEAAWTNAHTIGNSILLPAMMYLAASRNGNRVMFDGIDGDLVMSTPRFYIASLMRGGAWGEAWSEACRASLNNTRLRHLSSLAIMSISARIAFLPFGVRLLRQRISNTVSKGFLRGSLINRDFATSIRLAERTRDLQANRLRRSQLSDQEQHICAITNHHMLTPWEPARAAEGFDLVASRYGVEPRHPWYDRRLIEFYISLPLRQKVRDGWTKYLVRKAMAPALGRDVTWHAEKNHLGPRFTRLLMEQSRDEIESALGAAEGNAGKYLDIKQVYSLLHRYNNDGLNQVEFNRLYDAVTMAFWLRRVERGKQGAPAETRKSVVCQRLKRPNDSVA